MVTTQVKAEAAVVHLTRVVSMAEDAVGRADRRIDKAKDHLAQAEDAKAAAVQALGEARAELADWAKAAAAFTDTAAPGTAHDAGVRTESNN
jgi:hypothetical protein